MTASGRWRPSLRRSSSASSTAPRGMTAVVSALAGAAYLDTRLAKSRKVRVLDVLRAGRRVNVPLDEMSFEEGAALPIIYPTSYAALVDRARLQPGEDLLVHAAAGGVGIAAVQIGKALGARVIATAGGAEKCELAVRQGAEVAIDYREEDFVARVMELTEVNVT